MRTIGKKNKNLVIKITLEVLKKDPYTYAEDEVKASLPDSIWDTWESADSEINRIIRDTVSNHRRTYVGI